MILTPYDTKPEWTGESKLILENNTGDRVVRWN